jgi:hypothetical protein
VSRQPDSAARFSFQQNPDSYRRIAGEGFPNCVQIEVVMKTISIRMWRQILTATSLALATATGELARAADLSNGADNFYKSDKVAARKVAFKPIWNERCGWMSFPMLAVLTCTIE